MAILMPTSLFAVGSVSSPHLCCDCELLSIRSLRRQLIVVLEHACLSVSVCLHATQY